MPSQAVAVLLTSLVVFEPTRASLQVDATALGDAGPAVAERLTTRGERVLRDEDVLPGRGAEDALITIRVDALSDAIGYRYDYNVTRNGELVEGARGAAECRTCSEAELAEQLDDAIERLVGRLQPEHEDKPEVEPPPSVVEPQAMPAPPSGWNVGPMGGTGIALTGVGGLALGLGVGLSVAEPVLLDGNSERNSTVSVAGLAVAVVGVALTATGVALMLTDRSRSRRGSKTARWSGTTLRF